MSQYKRMVVLQGEVKISDSLRVEMTTVLGSCVAICLFDDVLHLGGMNHYLLSATEGSEAQEKKYGLYAFECLLNGLLKRGGTRHGLKAKVFGGASIDTRYGNLGKRNAAFAVEVLRAEGIQCVGQDVGGDSARKLRFIPSTGEAQVMRVKKFEEMPVVMPPKPKVEAPRTEFF